MLLKAGIICEKFKREAFRALSGISVCKITTFIVWEIGKCNLLKLGYEAKNVNFPFPIYNFPTLISHFPFTMTANDFFIDLGHKKW